LKALILAARQRKKARAGLSRGSQDAEARSKEKSGADFERPSTRTRISFERMQGWVAAASCSRAPRCSWAGAKPLRYRTRPVRYVDAIMIRMLGHNMLMELAEHAVVPVINGLTKLSHPSQVMADVMTLEEKKGPIRGRPSLGPATSTMSVLRGPCRRAFDFSLRVASPESLPPRPALAKWAEGAQAKVLFSADPRKRQRR